MTFSFEDISCLFEQYDISPYDRKYHKEQYEALIFEARSRNEQMGSFIESLFKKDIGDMHSLKVYSWAELEDELRILFGKKKQSYFTKDELTSAFKLFRKSSSGKTEEQLDEEMDRFMDDNPSAEELR